MRFAPDRTLLLSPSDLANYLACAHVTQLELRVLCVSSRARTSTIPS
jgi:hypothetical protein